MERTIIKIDPVATGKRLRQLMDDKGLSTKDVMLLLELESVQGIYKWFAGNSLPDLNHFVNIANILELQIEDILVVAPQKAS